MSICLYYLLKNAQLNVILLVVTLITGAIGSIVIGIVVVRVWI
jgi:hypothetical protein